MVSVSKGGAGRECTRATQLKGINRPELTGLIEGKGEVGKKGRACTGASASLAGALSPLMRHRRCLESTRIRRDRQPVTPFRRALIFRPWRPNVNQSAKAAKGEGETGATVWQRSSSSSRCAVAANEPRESAKKKVISGPEPELLIFEDLGRKKKENKHARKGANAESRG